MTTTVLHWPAPIDRPHAGALLGNGVQGLMVWGSGRRLLITVGRAGFWDHRWGNPFTTGVTYGRLAEILQAGDLAALDRAFGRSERPGWQRPQQLSAGRLVVELPAGWCVRELQLQLGAGIIDVLIDGPAGGDRLRLRQRPDAELAWLQLPAGLADAIDVRLSPAWDRLQAAFEQRGIVAPEAWATATGGGFLQSVPEDEPLAMGWCREGFQLRLATRVGADARRRVDELLDSDPTAVEAERAEWWRAYWQRVPRLDLPDPVVQEIAEYGLYKQACCTPPQGLACTLQGPFLEDYQLPPWSCDYHFNINVEMIYWPALASGCWRHLDPLWDLVRSWWPRLQQNAAEFFGADDAVMLPHAVDDRCQVVGSFWTGAIDHACTAWMALLAWQHYRFSGERDFLRDFVWPFARGAFAGFWAMLEAADDGSLHLPVSVSPEFGGDDPSAWGRDASFQVAACHALVRALRAMATELDEVPDPRWQRVAEQLPSFSLVEGPVRRERPADGTHQRIALWEGMDLIESHRHHSHLGGIFPFRSLDLVDADERRIVEQSIAHWVRTGPGAWSGWCVPWAAIIHARLDNAPAAIDWLHWWRRHFVNEGRGTLHDANHPGHSALSTPALAIDRPGADDEVMQLDAGFGALAAVFELLLQDRADGVHILPGRSRIWPDVAFDGVHCEGGFVVGATVADGALQEVRLRAERAGSITLQHGAAALVDGEQRYDGPACRFALQAGEERRLRAVVD